MMTDHEFKLAILNFVADHLFITFYLIVGASALLSCIVFLFIVGSGVGEGNILSGVWVALIGIPFALTASLLWPITLVLAIFFLNKALNAIPKFVEMIPQFIEVFQKLSKFFRDLKIKPANPTPVINPVG